MLCRPSQDCSSVYGEAVILNEVKRLSESEYEEREIRMLTAASLPGAERTHTLARGATLEVRDGLRRVVRPFPWRRQAAGTREVS